MKPIELHPIWKEKKVDFLQLNQYLQGTLAELSLTGAVAYGSVMRSESVCTNFSDIDIVAYSPVFSRATAQHWADYIAANSLDFFDKTPIYIEDHVTARLEFSIQLGTSVFDISVFPVELSGYQKRYTNTIHDRLDVVIGSMYLEGYLLIGSIPFEELLEKEFFPFYADDLRAERMKQLEARLHSSLSKIKLALERDEDDLLCQLYKARSYLIKWMFIEARKYPVDCNRYLERQLSGVLHTPKETIDALLLRGDSMSAAYHQFLCCAEEIVWKQHKS